MDLAKLFLLQKELDNHIENEHPREEGESRLSYKVLALLVELGELANEVRFFKFWSTNRRPRTQAVRVPTMMEEDKKYYNPTLEEYVDGWHFILSIGLELQIKEVEISACKRENLEDQFIGLYNVISLLAVGFHHKYNDVVSAYIGLGEMLGFTPEEIEGAYLVKNEINHKRQEVHY
ncbi:dUTP diphosphatase [Bacillus sp. ISL-40]|uniref:dUTP diphosphatase n=1 Tax=unclassified Bacillus (in: firmicutes) TaxID=185979 RepID=UPI001BE8F74D|nr:MULTISPECIES: dUTP diphosphatase [unclassified Bacillus (in: firmicutes)]MBT2696370.1 dUTP diphosphatase [Bacillus sp. ISL-40]MBT2743218.1 dUTP diphosphatase [Bacillus sp. ISL-77]